MFRADFQKGTLEFEQRVKLTRIRAEALPEVERNSRNLSFSMSFE